MGQNNMIIYDNNLGQVNLELVKSKLTLTKSIMGLLQVVYEPMIFNVMKPIKRLSKFQYKVPQAAYCSLIVGFIILTKVIIDIYLDISVPHKKFQHKPL